MEYNKTEMMKRFVEERKKFGTQEKLANAVGLNPKTISAYETGRKNPSLEIFVKMCMIMQADIRYIIYGNDLD